MRRCVLSSMVLAACAMFMGCGSVVIGSPDEATEATPAAAQTANAQDSSLDCDALMQALADSCFKVTAFQEDGTTPLHEVDEAGNDLGEVDQKWAAEYCECYAQLAFQTYGCQDVNTHQSLNDEEYDALYAPIIASCTTNTVEQNAEGTPAEDATDSAAPAEGATDSAAPAEGTTDSAAPAEGATDSAAPAEGATDSAAPANP